MLIQQGDVLIESVGKIPSGAKKRKPNGRGHVLAEGEATGHAHCITDVDNANLLVSDEGLYLNVLKDCNLTHEEHGTVTIAPGKYTVRRVREYDHFKEEVRRVQD